MIIVVIIVVKRVVVAGDMSALIKAIIVRSAGEINEVLMTEGSYQYN